MAAGHHSHAGHHGHGANEKRILQALVLTAGFMVVEVIGGILSGSLALLADAGHMFADAAALTLAWLAFRAGRRPADAQRSYGYHRLQVLAAFVNGLTMLAIVVWIAVEASFRLAAPQPVEGGLMMAVAFIGLLVNAWAFAILHGGSKENLNMRGAALHVLSDLLGSAAAIIAGIVVVTTGWMPIDPLLSLAIVVLIVGSAWRLVRQAAHMLLQGTPSELDPARVCATLRDTVPGIEDVHHFHAWSLASGRPVVTLHARIAEDADDEEHLRAIKGVLSERFAIKHATVQIERGACLDGPGCALADGA